MLVLTRRVGESLIIGDEGKIKLSVLRVQGNQVRIGIEAPRDVAVHREEIYRRVNDHDNASNEQQEVSNEEAAA